MGQLVRSGAKLDLQDEQGSTPLLLAAMKSLPYLSTDLLQHGANPEARNEVGDTPLLAASKYADWNTVKVFLDYKAKLEVRDKNGSTPLLAARNKRIAKLLVDSGADRKATDSAGNDILLSAASKGNYSTAEYWLQNGANVEKENTAGDTAFRIAVKNNSSSIVMLLAAYGAKLDISGMGLEVSPFMRKLMAVLEDKPFEEKLSQAQLAVESSEVVFQKPVAAVKVSETVNLLALDGGGIRGLVLCEMLIMIEKRRKELYPHGKPFLSNFHWLTGTSTGSLMALGHVYKGFTAEKGRAMYWSLKDRVFPSRGAWERAKHFIWSSDVLSDVLQDVLGEDTLNTKSIPRVVVPTTLANQNPPKLHLMCNYGDGRDGQLGPEQRKVWEAARASSAAPFYFPAFNDFFLDGGLLANNPAPDAMTEIHKNGWKFGCVISLGTGNFSVEILESMSTSVDLRYTETFLKNFKAAMRVLTQAIVPAATATEMNVQRAHAWCRGLGAAYFRFNPPLTEYIDLAETDENKLKDLLVTTQDYCRRNISRIDKLLETLY